MRKRIFLVSIAAVLVCSSLFLTASGDAEEADLYYIDYGEGELLYETDSVTREDWKNGFEDYALSDATVDFSGENAVTLTGMGTDGDVCNIVGVVKDYETDTLIPGATISIGEETLVTTGEDGRFQLKNFPSGKYDWVINADGYCTATYYNYMVYSAGGATIFTFLISKDFIVEKDKEEVMNNEDGQTIPPDTEMSVFENSATVTSMSSTPTVSSSVKVYYNGQTRTVNRQRYVYIVTSSELYAEDWYSEKGLTSSQITNLFRAQAMAANTWLEYAQSVYSNHSNEDYTVCSGQCCQRYDPTNIKQVAIDATASLFYTAGTLNKTYIIMYKPTAITYDYIWASYFSCCENAGTDTHPSQPALQAVSCTDLAQGADSDYHYGMCQMGAAQRAKNGESGTTIVKYYYTGCGIFSCTLN